jgi:hypothetical protein
LMEDARTPWIMSWYYSGVHRNFRSVKIYLSKS